MTTARQLFMSYHVRQIQLARAALSRTANWSEVYRLNCMIDRHTAAIHRLDREAQSADRQKAST